MADITQAPSDRTKAISQDVASQKDTQVPEPDPLIAYAELLFFAYRDFVSEPDQILEKFGFGRAHHRVLHFVHRNPGLKVAELLNILKITKQSLARVLKQLIDEGFISQKPGEFDGRERHLYATSKGAKLADDLAAMQAMRIKAALDHAGANAGEATRRFLFAMIRAEEQPQVAEIVDRAAKLEHNPREHKGE